MLYPRMLSGLSRGWPLVGYPLRAVLDWNRHHPNSFRLDGIGDPANATLLILNDYDHWQSQAGGTWDHHEISLWSERFQQADPRRLLVSGPYGRAPRFHRAEVETLLTRLAAEGWCCASPTLWSAGSMLSACARAGCRPHRSVRPGIALPRLSICAVIQPPPRRLCFLRFR